MPTHRPGSGSPAAALVRSLRLRIASMLALLLTVCVAALVAHVAIDALGDVALARDAYDGVAHGSRAAVIVGVLACALAATFRLLMAALDSTGGDRTLFARRLARVVARTPVAFVACTVAGAAVMLVGMETLDTFVATGRIVDVADALGGSASFGLALEVPIALAVGWVAWRALRWLADSGDAIVRAIEVLLAVPRRTDPARFARCDSAPRGISRELSVLARRAGKRGPPLPIA
jgi:hypothetical protein